MNTNDQIILSQILDLQSQELTDMNRATYFEFFSAKEILKDRDLSIDELMSGIIGKGNDGGVDGLYIFLNNELVREDTIVDNIKRKKNEIELHFIQAKRTPGFNEAAINKLTSTVEDLFDLTRDLSSLRAVYNQELLTATQLFRDVQNKIVGTWPDISFYFYYATMGTEVHPNTRRKEDRLRATVIQQFDNAKFSLRFLGARELLQLARREPKSTFDLEFSENPISTETGSYVCLVPLENYYRFFVDENNVLIKRIFDANVRDYQGNVKVNSAIQETLQKPGKEDFWFLNNGVTIVCPKASASGKKLIIEDPQIVNGLQTSYEIYNYYHGLKYEPNDNRRILVRVIVEQDAGGRDNIVRATNSQTAIPQTSLRAADKVQRDIEDYLLGHDYYYERRKNYYKNAGKPINRIISIPYFAQAVISVLLQKPDYARARPSTLIDKDDDYGEIFNEKYNIELYLRCIQIMKRCEDYLRTHGESLELSRKEINNIKFQLAMLAAMMLTHKAVGIKVEDIVKISVLTGLPDGLLSEQVDWILSSYNELGGSDQVAKSRSFTAEVIRVFRELNVG